MHRGSNEISHPIAAIAAAGALLLAACSSSGGGTTTSTGSGTGGTTMVGTGGTTATGGGTGGMTAGTGGAPATGTGGMTTGTGGAPVTGSGGMAAGTGGMTGTGGTASSSSGTGGGGGGGGGATAYDSCGLCAPGQLLMNGRCIQVEGEPAYGCGEDNLKPYNAQACPTAPHRLLPHCNGATCADGPCDPLHLDCDGQAANGCEANSLDPKTCGSCTNACAAGQVCRPGGICAAACGPTEIPNGSGGCYPSSTCSVPGCTTSFHGSASCMGSTCTITCDTGFTLCNGACVDAQRDPMHCGGCNACPSPPDGGAMACVAGACHPSCPVGLTLCGNTCADLATDLTHCGGCNAPCATGLCVGGTCNPGLSRVLVAGAAGITALAVDATTVFYVDKNAGAIGRVEKTGGPTQALASGQSNVGGIAADDAYVYWSSANSIRRVPKTGGTIDTVTSAPAAGLIAVDTADVFWAGAAVMKAPKQGGGASTTLATLVSGTGVTSLVLDGAYVYWGTIPGLYGKVSRTLKDGTGTVESATGLVGLRVAVDAGYVYNADDGHGYGIARTRKDFSGAPYNVVTLGGSADTNLDALGVGKHFLYLHTASGSLDGALAGPASAKALKCGGALVAPPPSGPVSPDPYGSTFVLDDAFVYGVVNGQLRRIPQ